MSFYSFTSYIIHFKVNNAAKVRKILEYSKQFAKIFLYAVVCKVNCKVNQQVQLLVNSIFHKSLAIFTEKDKGKRWKIGEFLVTLPPI